jgi:hypothetical protein
MAIIQISRIIQRSGNLVDLPQLAEAEFGWATDVKRLFIGKTEPNENIEVLTSYSTISFGQLDGSYGNLNFNNPVTGQIISYDANSNVWVNTGGNALNPSDTAQYSNNLVHLGSVDNVKLGGGSVGYVLETDGKGNLSWSSKGTLRNEILALSDNTVGNNTPVIIQVDSNTPYTQGLEITITGANAAGANTIINGQTFYIELANDFPISGNAALFLDPGLNTPVDGSALGPYTANSGIATALLGGSGAGIGVPAGITSSIQYNEGGGAFGGSAGLTWNVSSSLLNVTGNATISGTSNVGALSASSTVRGTQLISTTILANTPPLVVSSSTRVANLNAATAGNLITGTSNIIVDANGNISMSAGGNANIVIVSTDRTLIVSGNANIGNLIITGAISSTGNANIGNLGVTGVFATTLSATGNANVGNIGANIGRFTNVQGNGALLTNLPAGNIVGQVANALVAGTVYANAQPNITSTGTLNTLSVSGNATIGNIGTPGSITATGSIRSSGIVASNSSMIINSFAGAVEGAQMTMAYKGISGLTGQANSTWNLDVDASNNFRIFSVNASGVNNVPITLSENGNVTLSNALPITSGGTGQTTTTAAINALLPNQSGNSGNGLVTNGTNVSWAAMATEAWVKNLINTIEPIGTIKAWAGAIGSIPSGWALCNGANNTLNLTDRFITGFGGGVYQQNTTPGTPGGGSVPVTGSTSSAGLHSHSGSTAAAFLNILQIPGHAHTFRNIRYSESAAGSTYSWTDPVYGLQDLTGAGSSRGVDFDNGVYIILSGTAYTGGVGSTYYENFNGLRDAEAHYHGIFTDGLHNHSVTGTAALPGFFVLAFIQKMANLV